MKGSNWQASLVAAAALFASAQASAALIDFETEGAANGDNFGFGTTSGVTFSGTAPGLSNLEAVGGADADPHGFLNDVSGLVDDPIGAGLGNWFLRAGGIGPVTNPVLVIDYLIGPVSAARGEIWDIDGNANQGTEQWLVEAFLGLNPVAIDSDTSPLGSTNLAGSLNAKPWLFQLAGGFDRIELTFIGSKTDGVGLAFDNFNANVPEPAVLTMFGLGALLISLFVGLRRRVG